MLLGRGNLRSFVVVIVLAIAAQMTLKGLIAPARIAMVQASQATVNANSLPSAACVSRSERRRRARLLAALLIAGALALFAFAHDGFRRSPGQIAAGVIVGLLVAAGWFATGYLGADDFNPVPVTSLTFIAPIADTLQYAMLSTGLTLNFGIATVAGVFAGSLVTALATGRFHLEALFLAEPHAALGERRRADGYRRRHGVRLLDRAGAHRPLDACASAPSSRSPVSCSAPL